MRRRFSRIATQVWPSGDCSSTHMIATATVKQISTR